jgi:hypothetical protein
VVPSDLLLGAAASRRPHSAEKPARGVLSHDESSERTAMPPCRVV